jgi:general secretion pathway protein L
MADGCRASQPFPGAGETIRLLLRDDRGRVWAQTAIARTSDLGTAIETFLASHRLKKRDVAIGLALPAEKFFLRDITLPREVGRSVGAIAFNDLLQNTPLRAEDVYSDIDVNPAGRKLLVRQAVIRKKYVQDAVAAIEIDMAEIAFVEMDTVSTSNGFPARLNLRGHQTSRSWLPRTLLALLGISILCATAAMALEYQNRQAMIEMLASDVAATQAKAQKVRSALDATNQTMSSITALHARKQEGVALVDLWEEVSRILPDDSWVQELKLFKNAATKGYKVTISGFSPAAANLVELFDRSPYFQSVALTGPISLDPIEKRERFILEAGVQPPETKKSP